MWPAREQDLKIGVTVLLGTCIWHIQIESINYWISVLSSKTWRLFLYDTTGIISLEISRDKADIL